MTGDGVEGVDEQQVSLVTGRGSSAGGRELVDGVGDYPVCTAGAGGVPGVGIVGEVVDQCLVKQAEALAGLPGFSAVQDPLQVRITEQYVDGYPGNAWPSWVSVADSGSNGSIDLDPAAASTASSRGNRCAQSRAASAKNPALPRRPSRCRTSATASSSASVQAGTDPGGGAMATARERIASSTSTYR